MEEKEMLESAFVMIALVVGQIMAFMIFIELISFMFNKDRPTWLKICLIILILFVSIAIYLRNN